MVSVQTQKYLAIAMMVSGLFQAATAVTQDSLTWTLFYALLGLAFALSGAGFFWDAMKSAEQ